MEKRSTVELKGARLAIVVGPDGVGKSAFANALVSGPEAITKDPASGNLQTSKTLLRDGKEQFQIRNSVIRATKTTDFV